MQRRLTYHKYFSRLARKVILGGEIKAHNNSIKLKKQLKKITRQLATLRVSSKFA